MNWYKVSDFDIKDFDDRNIVNAKIRFLEMIEKYLQKLAKLVFQNGKLARSVNSQILNHKKISSYPIVIDLLSQADKIALDSPWKFADYCRTAAEELQIRVNDMKRKRKDFFDKTLPNHHMKGFTDGQTVS